MMLRMSLIQKSKQQFQKSFFFAQKFFWQNQILTGYVCIWSEQVLHSSNYKNSNNLRDFISRNNENTCSSNNIHFFLIFCFQEIKQKDFPQNFYCRFEKLAMNFGCQYACHQKNIIWSSIFLIVLCQEYYQFLRERMLRN